MTELWVCEPWQRDTPRGPTSLPTMVHGAQRSHSSSRQTSPGLNLGCQMSWPNETTSVRMDTWDPKDNRHLQVFYLPFLRAGLTSLLSTIIHWSIQDCYFQRLSHLRGRVLATLKHLPSEPQHKHIYFPNNSQPWDSPHYCVAAKLMVDLLYSTQTFYTAQTTMAKLRLHQREPTGALWQWSIHTLVAKPGLTQGQNITSLEVRGKSLNIPLCLPNLFHPRRC